MSNTGYGMPGRYQAVPPTLTEGDPTALSTDNKGVLNVNVVAGGSGGGGGTQYTDGQVAVTNPIGTQPVFTNGSGNVTAVSSANPLPITGTISVGSTTDSSSFTAGSSTTGPVAAVFNDSATALTSGQQGTTRSTANRALHTNLRNVAGTEIGTSSTPIRTDPTGTTTQPVSYSTIDLFPATQNITAQDIATSTVAGFQGQSFIIGNPTANSAATFTLSGITSVNIQLTGIWTGSLRVEASTDSGTTYVSKFSRLPGTVYAGAATVTSNAFLIAAVSGCTQIRIRSIAAWTGTATVKMSLSVNDHLTDVLNPIRLLDSTTNTLMTIKAASTAPTTTDTAVVVAVSPNSVVTSVNSELGDFTGTITNATQTTPVVATGLAGYDNVLVSINGTFTGATAIFQGSDDGGTTWYNTVVGSRTDSAVIEGGYTSLTSTTRAWNVNIQGFDSFRVNPSAVATGTVNVRISAESAPTNAGATVQLGAPIPAGTAVIGHVISDTGSTTAVTQATAANLNATVVGTGTFAVQADTELPAAAALADATANPTVPAVGGLNEVFNGTTWDRARTANADGQAVTGIPAAGGMTFNGSTWDRVSGGNRFGDGGSATGAVLEAPLLYNGSSFDRARGDATNGAYVQVKVLTPGTAAANLGKAEDTAHTTGDTGVFALGVRNDGAATAFSDTNGDYTPIGVEADGSIHVVQKAQTATLANVSSSATSVTLLAANNARKAAEIYNDSTQICYVKFGTTASSTSFTVPLAASAYYEIPGGYVGRIDGIWVSANGNARVTEIT